MGNPRKMLGSSRLPGKSNFLVFAFLIHHSAFSMDFIQLPLSMGSTCSWCCMYMFWVDWSLSLPQGWWSHSGKENVRKCVSHLGHTSQCSPVAHSPTICTGWWHGTCHSFPLLPVWNGLIILWHVNLWRLPLQQKVLQALQDHLWQRG